MYSVDRTLSSTDKKKIDSTKKVIEGFVLAEMAARIFFYSGANPDAMSDDELFLNHERIMFCLKERGEAKNG